MTVLTPAQIAKHAAAAGFRGTALRNAVAVALAESGGNPRAVGVNTDRWRSRDRGLWQINDHWHPEVSDAAAFNPATCAAAAYRISSGGKSWQPWSTWKNGRAQTQFGRAQIGVNQALAGGASTSGAVNVLDIPGPIDVPDSLAPLLGGLGQLPGALGGLGSLPGAAGGVLGNLVGIKDLTDLIKAPVLLTIKTAAWLSDAHNWQRVAMVSGGTIGVLIALGMIARSGAAGDTLQGVADPKKYLATALTVGTAVASGGTSVAAKGAATAAKGATAAKAAAATAK